MLLLRPLGPYLAEMVGAFALVFAGCGAIVIMAVAADDRAVGQAAALTVGGTVLLRC